MMSVNLNVAQHATGFPSAVLAREGGKHIYDVVAGSDTDNGNLVAVGDMVDIQRFAQAAVSKFTGKVVQKMPSGNWLVVVTDPGDACLVYTEPLTPYESPAALRNEAAFYNKQGDTMRCYELAKGDRFEVSAAGFSATPTPGKGITGVTAKKLTLAS